MHCDDKRTINTLENNIIEAINEQKKLLKQQASCQKDTAKNKTIQGQIYELDKFIQENKDQLKTMNKEKK